MSSKAGWLCFSIGEDSAYLCFQVFDWTFSRIVWAYLTSMCSPVYVPGMVKFGRSSFWSTHLERLFNCFLGTCQNCRVGLNFCCQLLWLLFLCSVLSRPQVGIPVRPLDWLQCLMFRITTQKTSIINGRSEDCWGFSLSLSFGLQLIHSHGLSKCKAIFNFLNSSGLLYSIGLDVRMKHYFFLDLIQFCTITRDTSGQVQLEIL